MFDLVYERNVPSNPSTASVNRSMTTRETDGAGPPDKHLFFVGVIYRQTVHGRGQDGPSWYLCLYCTRRKHVAFKRNSRFQVAKKSANQLHEADVICSFDNVCRKPGCHITHRSGIINTSHAGVYKNNTDLPCANFSHNMPLEGLFESISQVVFRRKQDANRNATIRLSTRKT